MNASVAIPVALINDTSVDRHHGCARVMRTLRAAMEARGLHIVASSPAHSDWRADADFLEALGRVRLVVVNGEGTIHHDRPAGRLLLAAGREAKARGIPAALINASWQANGSEFQTMLGDFDLVAVRESASLAEVQHTGTTARVVPDLSLYFPHTDLASRHGVGFTDSVVRSVAARLRVLREEFGGEGISVFDLVRGPVDRLRLLRFAVSSAEMLTVRGRLQSVVQAWQDAPAMSPTEDALFARIARLSLLVTGRFHALCFALVTGTPFLAVETNTHKIDGLLADVGVEPWRNTTVSAIDGHLLDQARGWTGREKANVDAFLVDARHRIDQLFDDLVGLAS